MKFSLVTHVPLGLDLSDLHRSILAQTVTDWEWILAPAPGVGAPESDDPRIRVVRGATPGLPSGAINQFAFASTTGDVLVEIGIYDVLTQNCLAELANVFSQTDVGFAYSNFAMPLDMLQSLGADVGWQYRALNDPGRNLAEIMAFDLSAASMAFASYAPGPIRAWRRSAYLAVGGHDAARDIIDDHELLIRSYLALPMKHIDKPLCISRYVGRDPAGQTEMNRLRNALGSPLYNEYAYRLAEREADLRGLKKIDLCGGFDKPAGYISLDQAGADITCDLNEGIPLPSNSVGVVRAHDAIEHLKNSITTMTEIHRVLADGGWAMILVPSTDGRGAFQDPTHVSFWNENSFWYWTRAQQARYIRNHNAKFQAFRVETIFPSESHRQTNISYVAAHLRAVKSDARRPHYQTI